MKRPVLAVVAIMLTATACSGLQENAQELRDKITNIDVDAALAELKDCDSLGDRFVGLVSTAADAIDGLAETTDGRIPATDIRRYVDQIAVTQYYDFAERIGCTQIQQRVRTLELLRELSPDSAEAQDFIDQILDQVETGA